MPEFEGNLRKMESSLEEAVQYHLPLYDVLEPLVRIDMNALLGKPLQLEYQGYINSVLSGKKMTKCYGEGLTYQEFMTSPLAVESIMHPELSRIHEGIALRDEAWERAHHLKPHYVYLALTSGVKVGVTRTSNVPFRWIDQGATQAILLAETPYRQAAGLIEVALKKHIADKTNWQQMLKSEHALQIDLRKEKERLSDLLPDELKQYITRDNTMMHLNYPVLKYPDKVQSIQLLKTPLIEGILQGIKGQYLMFDGGKVINIRSHTGYRVKLTFN